MKLSIIIESRDKVNYKNINDNEILYLISDNNEVANNYIYEKYKPSLKQKRNTGMVQSIPVFLLFTHLRDKNVFNPNFRK